MPRAAAREVGAGAQLRLCVEPEALQDRAGAAFGGPGIDVGQPVLDIGDAVRIMRRFRLGQKRGALGVGLKHGIKERSRRRRHFLRHAPDARPRRQAYLAALKRQFAPDQPEERRLAGAVTADKTDLVAGGNGGRGPFEQGAAFDGIGDIGNAQHARGMPDAAPAVNRRSCRVVG
jgi:hypothetical protein